MELVVINRENCDECEIDFGEESEIGCRLWKFFIFQFIYYFFLGECFVMFCLSQFCVFEMLDGNNKFVCEECSKCV